MSQDLTLRDYYKIFWKNKWFIGMVTFIVSVLAIIISLVLPKWYAGTVQVIRPQSQVLDMTSIQMQTMDIFGVSDASTNRFLSILNSRALKEEVCKKFDLMNSYDVKWMDKAVERFTENYYKVEVGEEFQIVVTILDRDQERVAGMANYVVFLLDSINTSLSTEYGSVERQFIEEQLNSVTDSLTFLENKLVEYMKENSVLSINDQLSQEIKYATDLKYDILLNKTELKIMKHTNSSQLLVESKEMQIAELQDQYDKLFGSNSELFIDLNEASTITIKVNNIQRKLYYYNDVLNFLGPLYEQAKILEMKEIPAFEVLDYAHRPDRKAKPKRVIIVVGSFLFALLSSGVYVLLKDTQK